MKPLRPLSTHFGFLLLFAVAMFGAMSIALHPSRLREDPGIRTVTLQGAFMSVRHESRTRGSGWPDSVMTIQPERGAQRDFRVRHGANLMDREWAALKAGDQVQLRYVPIRQGGQRLPEFMVMRSDHFYIDREMIVDRMRAMSRGRYWMGVLAMGITVPWMLAWGWQRLQRAKRELALLRAGDHVQNDSAQTGPLPQGNIASKVEDAASSLKAHPPETTGRKIYRYALAAVMLPVCLYGLVTGDSSILPITGIGCFLILMTARKR